MAIAKIFFWASPGALVWTHVATRSRRRARAPARGRCAATMATADGRRDRRRARRGGGDRAAASRTCSSSTTRPTGSRSSSPPTRRPTGPRSSRAAAGRARDPQPARREGRSAGPRGARDRRRDRRVLRRERDLGAGRAADARPRVRRSGRRLRLRAAPLEAADGSNRGGSTGATSCRCARPSRARLDHRRQRLDLRRAPLGLRRGRPALRSRPLLSVPDGAARQRAVYEAEAIAFEKPTPTNEDEYRRKVRMFEHCWAIVLEGKMLRRLRPLYLVEIVSHRHLRYASGLLHLVLLGRRRAARRGPCTGRARPQLAVLAAAASARRGALLRARHVGDGGGARRTTSVTACRRRGRRRRGRGDPPGQVADERSLDPGALCLGDDRLPRRLVRDSGLDDAVGGAAELLHLRLDKARFDDVLLQRVGRCRRGRAAELDRKPLIGRGRAAAAGGRRRCAVDEYRERSGTSG